MNSRLTSTTDQVQLSKIVSLLMNSHRRHCDVLPKLSITACRHTEFEREIKALITRSGIVERRVTYLENLSACLDARLNEVENRSRALTLLFRVRRTQCSLNDGMRLRN